MPEVEGDEEVKKVPPEIVSGALPKRSLREKKSKSPAAKDQSTLKKAAVKAHQTRMDEFIVDWMNFFKYPEMDGMMLKEILVEMELKLAQSLELIRSFSNPDTDRMDEIEYDDLS